MSEAIKAAVELLPALKERIDSAMGGRANPDPSGYRLAVDANLLLAVIAALEALRPVALGKSVIVPVEPTEAMLKAGRGSGDSVTVPAWMIPHGLARAYATYRAMISASNT